MRILPQFLMMRARNLAGPFFHPWTQRGAPLVRGPGAAIALDPVGDNPSVFTTYTESWPTLAVNDPIGGAPAALDASGNWVTAISAGIDWTDLAKAANTPAGAGFAYFKNHDTPGVWGYYNLAMQNTAKPHFPDYCKITFNVYSLLGQNVLFYIYNYGDAFDGVNNGDAFPTIAGDPGYLMLEWNGSTGSGPYLRLSQSDQGSATSNTDYDIGPLTAAPYNQKATLTLEIADNGGQRQYRCTMDAGNIDSGWFNVNAGVPAVSTLSMLLQVQAKNHQAIAFLGNVKVEQL